MSTEQLAPKNPSVQSHMYPLMQGSRPVVPGVSAERAEGTQS